MFVRSGVLSLECLQFTRQRVAAAGRPEGRLSPVEELFGRGHPGHPAALRGVVVLGDLCFGHWLSWPYTFGGTCRHHQLGGPALHAQRGIVECSINSGGQQHWRTASEEEPPSGMGGGWHGCDHVDAVGPDLGDLGEVRGEAAHQQRGRPGHHRGLDQHLLCRGLLRQRPERHRWRPPWRGHQPSARGGVPDLLLLDHAAGGLLLRVALETGRLWHVVVHGARHRHGHYGPGSSPLPGGLGRESC
mmetsp:Transcript_3990/g.6600  ORF Transcript_3990/g.6600 Transcript_3990/m.6600 type:complete len:245 (-) Transcript_3990:72-806(-)